MTCTAMIALEISSNSDHMPISKMPKHEILNRCGSQTPLKDDDFLLLPYLWFLATACAYQPEKPDK